MTWREFKPLEEDDPMPFGKHKGKPMREVPSDYLWRLWSNEILKPHTAIFDYVMRHRWRIRQAGLRVQARQWKNVFWCCGGPFGEEDEDDDAGFCEFGLPGDPSEYGDRG